LPTNIRRVAKFRENQRIDGGERVFGKNLDANSMPNGRSLLHRGRP